MKSMLGAFEIDRFWPDFKPFLTKTWILKEKIDKKARKLKLGDRICLKH